MLLTAAFLIFFLFGLVVLVLYRKYINFNRRTNLSKKNQLDTFTTLIFRFALSVSNSSSSVLICTFFRYCSFFPWSVSFVSFSLLASPASSIIRDTFFQITAYQRTDSSLAFILCTLSPFYISEDIFSSLRYRFIAIYYLLFFYWCNYDRKFRNPAIILLQDFARRYLATSKSDTITAIDAFLSEFRS